MISVVLISLATSFALQTTGYQRITLEAGTLYGKIMGTDKHMAVLLVAGSGPTDMDGNTPNATGRNDSLLLLANNLASENITTFRYDKRTAGKSAGTFDQSELKFDWLVSDCVATIRHLKELGYEKIIVVGHSQGSLVGMTAALQESVDGFISLAGAGLPIDITLEKQLRGQLPQQAPEFSVIRSLRAGEIDTTVRDNHPLFSPDLQQFLLTWMKYDPAKIVAQLNIPLLIVQGEADIQVDAAEFEALQNSNADATSLLIENMNHVLKEVDDPQDMASYSDPSYPLHKKLVPAMVDFITGI